jgi:hypothetical protein
VDGGGRGLPRHWFGFSSFGDWAEPATAEGGNVDSQLRRQILEVGEHGLGLAELPLCSAAAGVEVAGGAVGADERDELDDHDQRAGFQLSQAKGGEHFDRGLRMNETCRPTRYRIVYPPLAGAYPPAGVTTRPDVHGWNRRPTRHHDWPRSMQRASPTLELVTAEVELGDGSVVRPCDRSSRAEERREA